MEKERLIAILDSCQYSTQGLRLVFEQLPGWRIAVCSSTYPEFIQLIGGKKIDLIIYGTSHFEDDLSRILYLPGLTDGFSVLLTNKHSPVLANIFLTAGFDLVLSKQTSLPELEKLFSYRQFYTNVALLKNKKNSRYLPQERGVLSALLRGEKARDIARRLGMSYSTVSRHKQNGLKRAGIRRLNDILLSLK